MDFLWVYRLFSVLTQYRSGEIIQPSRIILSSMLKCCSASRDAIAWTDVGEETTTDLFQETSLLPKIFWTGTLIQRNLCCSADLLCRQHYCEHLGERKWSNVFDQVTLPNVRAAGWAKWFWYEGLLPSSGRGLHHWVFGCPSQIGALGHSPCLQLKGHCCIHPGPGCVGYSCCPPSAQTLQWIPQRLKIVPLWNCNSRPTQRLIHLARLLPEQRREVWRFLSTSQFVGLKDSEVVKYTRLANPRQ